MLMGGVYEVKGVPTKQEGVFSLIKEFPTVNKTKLLLINCRVLIG